MTHFVRHTRTQGLIHECPNTNDNPFVCVLYPLSSGNPCCCRLLRSSAHSRPFYSHSAASLSALSAFQLFRLFFPASAAVPLSCCLSSAHAVGGTLSSQKRKCRLWAFFSLSEGQTFPDARAMTKEKLVSVPVKQDIRRHLIAVSCCERCVYQSWCASVKMCCVLTP